MLKNKKFWIVLFAAVTVLLCIAALLLLRGKDGTVANIYLDGELYRSIDLSRVTTPYDIVITTQYGSNTVHVERGAICVSEADCRDHICVGQGTLTRAGVPIVCLPHRLVIELEGDGFDV